MKPTWLLIALLAVFNAGVASAQTTGTPKIQFDKTVYDFGQTSGVQRVAGTFKFKNVGDAVLKLERPTTTCGCTVANLASDTLQPGETGELSFTLNVGPSRQTLQKNIIVRCNDPANSQVNLTLKVDFIPAIEITPTMLYVDNVRVGSTTNAQIQLKRVDGKPLTITSVKNSDPWIKTTYRPPAAAEQIGFIDVEIKPEGVARRFSDNVRIMGDNPTDPLATFFISGRAVGELACLPEQLYFTLSGQAVTNFAGVAANPLMTNLITRRLILNATDPKRELNITNVTSTIKGMQLTYGPKGNKSSYELVARLTEPVDATTAGKLTILTDLPSQSRIDVPVTIHVLKR